VRDQSIRGREALTRASVAAETLVRPMRATGSGERQSDKTRSIKGSDLSTHNARPLDSESPIQALRTFETRNHLFFLRSHHPPPAEMPVPWTLTIDGDVSRPVTFRLDEILDMRAEHRTLTIECAGNGRGRLELPQTSGVQWGVGAVGTATWTGVPLAALLERAGVRPSALHFWMEAADCSPMPEAPRFLRSIPRRMALDGAFVAYEMNGQPLPFLHGGPLRLVVPRWYGMASTKWLTAVRARATESENHFMVRAYRYADGSAVEVMRVKSLITAPLEGDRLDGRAMRLTGVAWTGTGTVAQVEISLDGGSTWQQARFTTEPRPSVWRLWEADVVLRTTGAQRVRARATDTAGHTQPERSDSNPGGYGNNSIHEVRFVAA
jgi:DMSO/TMAO reductase YedYZ molybdopterin-dependent catalytic subunit